MASGELPFGTAWNHGSGSGSGVQSVVAGAGVTVDATDPENPIVNVAPALRILGQYQFLINFTNDANGLCNNGEGNDGRWLATSNADGALALDGDSPRGFPFYVRGNAGTAFFAAMAVQVVSADDASVDAGTWDWTFHLYDDAVDTGLACVIASDAVGAQFESDEGAVGIATGSMVRVLVEGAQRTGGPATAATIQAWVTVTLYSS